MDIAAKQPFMTWLAAQKRLGGVEFEGKDIILADVTARRFALGVHDGMPLFCWHHSDASALESIPWTSAAIAYAFRGRDWVALSCRDARVRDSAALNPVSVRMFVPVTAGRMGRWEGASPSMMAVGSTAAGQKAPHFAGTPWKQLPLKLLLSGEMPGRARPAA